MRYWLTTHWPRPKHESDRHEGVWVKDEDRSVIADVLPGDLVAIYESGTGPAQRRSRADGKHARMPRQRGRQGLVEIHEVIAAAQEPDGSKPETYWDGSTRWWRWHAATRSKSSAGFVPRVKINGILGFKPGYVLRGLGKNNSGLLEVTASKFERLLHAFQESHREEDHLRAKWVRRGEGKGGGGEGPAHKALKLAIAADPALLGEHGLELVKVEFPFPTGDRIDVLLRDCFGRMVAVEVEGDCSEHEVAGPLQCMKYRALVAYVFERSVDEVRTILVAPTIHAAVVEKLARYEVESRLVGPIHDTP